MIETVFILTLLSSPGIPQDPRNTITVHVESMEACRKYEALWHSRETFKGKIKTMCLEQKSDAIAE